MFYIILILQKIIYATNIGECVSNAGKNENILVNINTCDTNELYMIAQKIVENNNTHSENYESIVKKYVKKYEVVLNLEKQTEHRLKHKKPIFHESDDIENLCNGKETHTNVCSDKFYRFRIKLFIESAEFSLDTIATVLEKRREVNRSKNYDQEMVDTDPKLFYDFIIAINWYYLLSDNNYEICLLRNYKNYLSYYDDQIESIIVTSRHDTLRDITVEKNVTTDLIECIQQYYKENDFTSNIKIIENESKKKLNKWVHFNKKITDKLRYDALLIEAKVLINIYRSMQTKINYLAKPNYATNKVRIKKKYDFTEQQKEFIEKLQLDGIVKDIYNLKFNTMRMHTQETILEGIAIISTFEENINRLIAFTKHIDQFLLDNTKEKLKKAIQTSKKIPKNIKNRCMIEIDEIANDVQHDAETSLTKTQAMLEKTNKIDTLCDTIINRSSLIGIDPMHGDKLTNKIQRTKDESKNEEINALYFLLIKSLNEIIDKKHKLDEKRTEIVSIKKSMEDVDFFAKDIEAGTLQMKAAIQAKKYNDDPIEGVTYSLLDQIIVTKDMIVETEALVFEILKEIRKRHKNKK